ncbi:hypothetical protein KA012_05040, partial [Candidatus Woesebacteria bacterium]|nr:hypothetical protein [Candidatus Woesebacteria bacterium]
MKKFFSVFIAFISIFSLFNLVNPVAAKVSAATPAPTPLSVTVVTPNGGETLRVGSTYRIRWNASAGIDKVSIGYK